jgi:hypothetical protein
MNDSDIISSKLIKIKDFTTRNYQREYYHKCRKFNPDFKDYHKNYYQQNRERILEKIKLKEQEKQKIKKDNQLIHQPIVTEATTVHCDKKSLPSHKKYGMVYFD